MRAYLDRECLLGSASMGPLAMTARICWQKHERCATATSDRGTGRLTGDEGASGWQRAVGPKCSGVTISVFFSPGKAADIIALRVDTLGQAGGAVHDPVAARSSARRNRLTYPSSMGGCGRGRARCPGLDLPTERHNACSPTVR